MRVGRNEACPCGSGKKFKGCCEGKARTSRGLMLLLATIGVLALVGLGSYIAGYRKTETTLAGSAPGAAAPRANTPQPGPAPAGKVWSQEHGHWHDAAPTGAGAPPAAARPQAQVQSPTAPQSQPPGPAPAGKVWAADHGHWHDAPR